jgi:tetratricopeptide (TPR) repeat protein
MAWNIRGLAYQTLGDYDKARRSYEAAVENLQAGPEQREQYASALDNLGSLDFEIGQWRVSRSLRLRAKRLYALENDHAGIARMSTRLALLALGRANRREARRYLVETFREQSLVPVPDSGDLAETYFAQSLLDGREGDFPSALISINRAIELWKRHYGAQYYMLAPGYALRGQVFSKLGDHKNAVNDLQMSLALLKASNDVNPAIYFLTEATYAGALRRAGLRSEARRMQSEASASLEGLRHQQCAGCSVSAQSLR